MSSSKKQKRKLYLKRIISDIAEFVSDPVENIHIWYDEKNITSIKALIIGPGDTPYQDGFYFFSLEFPESYPFTNPTAKFETINQKIRFNPNLYEGGKVCLSILGTWSGPKWSSVQTLKSVLSTVLIPDSNCVMRSKSLTIAINLSTPFAALLRYLSLTFLSFIAPSTRVRIYP